MRDRQIFIASVILFLVAVILTQFSDQISNKSRYAENLQKVLYQKQEQSDRLVRRLELADNEETLKIIQKANKENIHIFRYVNSFLEFWSSNALPVFEEFPDSLIDKRIIKLSNSFYYVKHIKSDSIEYLSFILVKRRYSYSNDFLQSGFDMAYKLPKSAVLVIDESKGFSVYDQDESYLFSIEMSDEGASSSPRSMIATILVFLGLFLLCLYIYKNIARMVDSAKRNVVILGIIILTILLRFFQVYFAIRLNGFVLFDAFIYADSLLVPSMGDLAINSILFLFLAIIFIRFFSLEFLFKGKSSWQRGAIVIVLSLIIEGAFIYAHYFSDSLIFNSNISFQANEIDQLSIHSIISFIIHGINFLTVGLLFIHLVRILLKIDTVISVLPFFILSTAFVFTILYMTGNAIDLISITYFYIFGVSLLIILSREVEINSYSILMVFILSFSIYSLLFFTLNANEKEYINRSTLAISLDNEHDPVAEYLFEDMSQTLLKDTSIRNQINRNQNIIYELYDYLQKNYFTGFWQKYDLQITLCGPADSVLLESHDFEWFHCYGFFDEIIEEVGFGLPNTRFYYLDFGAGRIRYLGRFVFTISEPPYELTLFIELDSRLSKNLLLGYPELLLDERIHNERIVEQYASAKYYDGQLMSQSGEFSYSLSSALFGDFPEGFSEVNLDGYNHLLYSSDGRSLIVLSRPKTNSLDLVIAFSYLFLFYYLGLAIYIGVRKINMGHNQFLQSLRSKIQFSILSILIVSLIFIAASAIWLSVRSYRLNQDTILHEKVQSVLIELTHKLAYEEELSPSWHADKYDNLNQLLIKFSDVFYSDINMYDPNGNLLATSRAEVFDLGLQGEKIDPIAYFRLNSEKRAQFIQREKISKLSYLSAYVPFENIDGDLLAYLNLPYFTKQKDLQSAITTLVVTIVNIYVILILITIVITIFISDQITKPLDLLQLRFRELKLGSGYEKIQYKRKDEIGKLVAEYNRMVSELEESVNRLARSERESAWREMAKQIAHEIKNPLTPMRLGIQQLQKSWKDGRPDFDKQLDNLAGTLLEQIDTLSAIASEFSNFAKMPAAKNQNMDIVLVLRKAVELFEGDTNCTLYFNSSLKTAIIKADKKQLSRVFINIIKNGIQSITEGKKGEINVSLEKIDDQLRISIRDNGRGIPDDIKAKLFMPNFTTKTSGMGLGLAIVYNILDPLGATIDFKTKVGEGSNFILSFPYVEKH